MIPQRMPPLGVLPSALVASFLFAICPVATQDVVISEFMADNEDGVTDDDGTRQDWIELRNTTASPVNLSGWYLSDNAARRDKWPFPAVTLPAGGSLLVCGRVIRSA